MKTIQNYINHVAFVIDASSSMSGLTNEVTNVFDNQIAYLARQSKDMDQETRVSVYLFESKVKCLIYDMDVLRLPSLVDFYEANGMTALIDGTLQALQDLSAIPELYADHSYLIYVLTDGAENQSNNPSSLLRKTIEDLDDNWTIAIFVPDELCKKHAINYGFPEHNIETWSVGKGAVKNIGETIRKTTTSFMTNRTQGIRGTRNLFKVDAAHLTKTIVSQSLEQLSAREYEVIPVRKDASIRDYIEDYTKQPYVVGSGYYSLTKKETIQPNKSICIRDRKNGKVYSGHNARKLLGLPDFEIKVSPETYGNWEIYVQSNSTNRKLIKGTDVIVLK